VLRPFEADITFDRYNRQKNPLLRYRDYFIEMADSIYACRNIRCPTLLTWNNRYRYRLLDTYRMYSTIARYRLPLTGAICFTHNLNVPAHGRALIGHRAAQHCSAVHQAGAELGTEEHMFSRWRMRGYRFRDVPSHLSSQAKVIVFSLSLI